MKIVGLVQTCEACPSQWEGQLEDGRSVYARYRFGYLSIHVSRNPGKSALGEDGECVYGEAIGDAMDGFMDTSEMLCIADKIAP